MNPVMIGWPHGTFGRHDGLSLEHLIASVAELGAAGTGLSPEDIDAAFLGRFDSGFSDWDFNSSPVMNALPALRFRPAT